MISDADMGRNAAPKIANAKVDPWRKRSAGVLTRPQIQWCQKNQIPLAYDTAQVGWVPTECEDDITAALPETKQFTYREWTQEDAPVLAGFLSSERLWQYLPEDYTGPLDETAAAALIELGQEDHHEVLAVVRDSEVIGQVRLLFSGPGEAEISYWLGEPFWGRGYASQIVSEYSDRSLRQHPDLNRLFARVHKDHKASLRILEKASFTPSAEDGIWIILDRTKASK